MRIVLLAMVLSVMQAAPPIPRQAADSSAQASKEIKQNIESQKSPPERMPQAPSADGKVQSPSHQTTGSKQRDENAQHSVVVSELPPVTVASPKRDWADWGTWILNILLVVVGFLQALLLCWTFRLIRHQSREMTRQRILMGRQLKAMQGQLAQMESSGSQTDRMIEQATATAIAAKVSADAAIASERAWVMVDLEKAPDGFLFPGAGLKGPNVSVRISGICTNHGKTPAKILEKRAALILVTPDNPLPPIPDLGIEIEDPVPHFLQSGGEHKSNWRLETQLSVPTRHGDMVIFYVIYGVVKYRHLFSEQVVQTTFGYRIRVDSVLERLIEHPEYNKNT